MRSYRDLCGIARALDIVGERWALLVVRELLFGPKRFADLHRGLPGLSQNVLTQRLRELQSCGVVTRRRALPPGTGLVYALTDQGRALEPVLLALGRWGSPLPPLPGWSGELSPDALVVALRTTFDPVAAGDLSCSVQLHLPGDAFHLIVDDGVLKAVRGEASADADLTAGVRTIQNLVFDGQDVDEVIRSGVATADGDTDMLRRFVTVFNDHRGPSFRSPPP